MEFLPTRPVVIALAVLGAVFALAATLLQARGVLTEPGARRLNRAGYILMGASMALFIWAGLRGVPG